MNQRNDIILALNTTTTASGLQEALALCGIKGFSENEHPPTWLAESKCSKDEDGEPLVLCLTLNHKWVLGIYNRDFQLKFTMQGYNIIADCLHRHLSA